MAAVALGTMVVPAPGRPKVAGADTEFLADSGMPSLMLEPGKARFWSGVFTPNTDHEGAFAEFWSSGVPHPAASCGAHVDCDQYRLAVPSEGLQLRVAVDVPFWQGSSILNEDDPGTIVVVDLSLTDPTGKETWAPRVLVNGEGTRVGGMSTPDGPLPVVNATREVIIDGAPAGEWLATVFKRAIPPGPGDGRDGDEAAGVPFRMRARLGAPPGDNQPTKILSPNLRVFAPYDFSFECFEEETVESGSTCLRFAFGHVNAGEGRLDLEFHPNHPDPDEARKIWQVRYSRDGSEQVRTPAGDLHEAVEYHEGHDHYHYLGMFSAELFRRNPKSGELVPIHSARKVGACGHDWKMIRWNSFLQAPAGSADSGIDCDRNDVADKRRFGLSPGYGDVYTRATTDNYVEFPADEKRLLPAQYVLRGTADIPGWIIESDETDNMSYTLLEVSRDLTSEPGSDLRVKVLERGFGLGPDDPSKEIVQEWDPKYGFRGP